MSIIMCILIQFHFFINHYWSGVKATACFKSIHTLSFVTYISLWHTHIYLSSKLVGHFFKILQNSQCLSLDVNFQAELAHCLALTPLKFPYPPSHPMEKGDPDPLLKWGVMRKIMISKGVFNTLKVSKKWNFPWRI